MAVDHEAPYAALESRLQLYVKDYLAIPVSRKLKSFDQLGQGEHPALFVVATTQTPVVSGPAKAYWNFKALVFVYARGDTDPGASAESALNLIVSKVEAALERQTTEAGLFYPGQQLQHYTTLGGVVQQAIPGNVLIETGAQGNEGIAVMEIDMMVPPA